MTSDDRLSLVRSYLATQHMFVDNEWLMGCVEYLTEDSSNNYSLKDLQNLAKEQWLLNDLKDICPGSLPPNLKNLQKTSLNGRFVLQVNAAVDIGTPAYQQYLKLQKVNTENIDATTKFEEKVSNHRMIKLYLTDGVQELSAIEYKPMRNLSCDITPGCKIMIKGPIECRRGVLLLTESSIELLGGEVQEIAVSNSLSGLLSSKLGIPISQETNRSIMNPPRNENITTPHSLMLPNGNQNQGTTDLSSRPVARVTSVQVADTFVDDDIDLDEIAELEAQVSDNMGKRSLNVRHSKPEKRLKIDPIVNRNSADDYPNEEDLVLEEDEDYFKEMEERFDAQFNIPQRNRLVCDSRPITVSSEPFVYIKQINNMKESDRVGRVFKVKGQIMKLLSKLSVGKDGWSLRCTIVDGTGSIDVDFTSDVLSKLVGFTPHEMNQLKKQMVSRPELKEKAITALQKAKDALQVLYSIIELTILEAPKITRLVPFEEMHVTLLRKRLPSDQL